MSLRLDKSAGICSHSSHESSTCFWGRRRCGGEGTVEGSEEGPMDGGMQSEGKSLRDGPTVTPVEVVVERNDPRMGRSRHLPQAS
jgi:hypothetical protein